MKTKLIVMCTVAVCLLTPAGMKFDGGPAPNELLIKEEPVVLDVPSDTFYTSFLCYEEPSDRLVLGKTAQRWDTPDLTILKLPAFKMDKDALFANSGSDTADPAETRVNLIQVTVTAMVPELPLLEGLGAIGACTETVT